MVVISGNHFRFVALFFRLSRLSFTLRDVHLATAGRFGHRSAIVHLYHISYLRFGREKSFLFMPMSFALCLSKLSTSAILITSVLCVRNFVRRILFGFCLSYLFCTDFTGRHVKNNKFFCFLLFVFTRHLRKCFVLSLTRSYVEKH